MHARESDLAGSVRSFLESRGYSVIDEVAVGGRRADLVGIGESIAAVELKLRDWRTALRQAMAYQLGAEYVWVAMPLASAAVAFRYRDRFDQEGVGLLGVIGAECRTIIEAVRSPRFLPPLAETARTAWAAANAWRTLAEAITVEASEVDAR